GAGVDIDLGHHLGDQRDQGLGPSGAADSEEFAGRGVHHLGHLTHRPAAGVEDTEPHQLVVMELVRVLGGRQAGGVHQEEHAAQSVGGVPAVHAGQTHEKPPGMVPGGFHDDLAVGGARPTSCSSDQAGAGGEALLGGVGPDLDDESAADAVRLGDAPDEHLHRKSFARQRSASTTSTRTSGPATDVTIVRMADAVRPPRPMTRPRSSGDTATRITVPRRPPPVRTDTASGSDTMPRTRWSTASTTMSFTGLRPQPRSSRPRRSRTPTRRRTRRPWLPPPPPSWRPPPLRPSWPSPPCAWR